MISHLWGIRFVTLNPLPSLPRFRHVYETRIEGHDYDCSGHQNVGGDLAAFQYTLSGYGIFHDGRESIEVGVGRCFLFCIGDPVFRYYYPAEASEPWIVLWGHIESDVCTRQVAEINRSHGYVFDLPESIGIIRKLLTYRTNGMQNREIPASESARLVHDLIADILRSRENTCRNTVSGKLVKEALEWLGARDGPLPTVREMADALQVSREHLSRVFKSHTGRSIHDFLLEQAIELAGMSLRESRVSIKEIADELGFPDQGQFCVIFKRRTGLTPKEYRLLAMGESN